MNWPLVIGLVIIADFAVAIGLVALVFRLKWRPLAQRFPPHPPAADAVARPFQSFRLGVMNMGFSVHVAVDEAHLHLTPARPLQWLGAAPTSVPWDAIELQASRFGGRWLTVQIAGRRLVGPSWCLRLAAPADGAGERASPEQ